MKCVLLVPICCLFLTFGLTESSKPLVYKRDTQTQNARKPTLHELLERNRNGVSRKRESQDDTSSFRSHSQRTASPSSIDHVFPDGDVIKDYSSPSSYPFAPSYADPSLLSAVMNQADEANFRYPNHKYEPEKNFPRLKTSSSVRTTSVVKSAENEVDPFEVFPPDFHEFLEIPVHIYPNQTDASPVETIETDDINPLISGGYASVNTNGQQSSTETQNDLPRKPVIRPARRRIPSRRRIRPSPAKDTKSDVTDDPKESTARPSFPKRLPPVRSGASGHTRRVVRPVRYRKRKPQVTQNEVTASTSSPKPSSVSHITTTAQEEPVFHTKQYEPVTQSTIVSLRNNDFQVPLKSDSKKEKIRRPVIPNYGSKFRRNRISSPIVNENFNREDSFPIKAEKEIPQPVKLFEPNVEFKPSRPDPFVDEVQFRAPVTPEPPVYKPFPQQTPVYKSFPQQNPVYKPFPQQAPVYDPEVLPPIVNSYARTSPPGTDGRFDRIDHNPSVHYDNTHVNIQPHTQTHTFPPRFSNVRPQDVQNQQFSTPHLRPPPPPLYNSHPQNIRQNSPRRPQRRPQRYNEQRRRNSVRRPPPPKRPSFLQSLGFFSRRKGELLPPVKRPMHHKKRQFKKPVKYVLSHGPPPTHGKKVVVLGPFKAPPIGAPFLQHTVGKHGNTRPAFPAKNILPPMFSNKKQSYQSDREMKTSKRRDNSFKVVNVPPTRKELTKKQYFNKESTDDQPQINYFKPAQALTQRSSSNLPLSSSRGDIVYGTDRSSVYNLKGDTTVAEVSTSYAVLNPVNRVSNTLPEVTEEDKERLIAAKFFFPKVPSIRRSGSNRHFIPLPVPMLDANGQQVMSVQQINLPRLPTRRSPEAATVISKPSKTVQNIFPTPRQMQSFPPRSSTVRKSPKYSEPVSFVDPVLSSPISYEGWQAVDSRIPRTPVVGILKEQQPSFPMQDTFFKPKVQTVDPRVFRRQPRKLDSDYGDYVRYSTHLKVEGPSALIS